MSKPTIPAAGAMPSKGQPNPTPSQLVNEISAVRSLIECAWMAGASLPKEECDAIQTVLRDAERRLFDIEGKIDRRAPAEGRGDD